MTFTPQHRDMLDGLRKWAVIQGKRSREELTSGPEGSARGNDTAPDNKPALPSPPSSGGSEEHRD